MSSSDSRGGPFAPVRRVAGPLALCLLALRPAWAQAPAALALPELEGRGPLALSAVQLVQMTLQRNPGLLVARLQAEAAQRMADAERNLYTPTGFGRVRREGVDRPRTYEERTASLTNIEDAAAIEKINTGSAGVRGRLPSGATLELSHEMRQRQSNLLATPDEHEYRGTLTLTLKQPLLRGAGQSQVEADLRVAELEQQAERQRLQKQVLDTVGEAAGTYWQLLRAGQTRQLRERAVQSALELQAEVKRRVDGGVAPRIELLEAESVVGNRQTELLRADQQLVETRARVRNLLNLDLAGERGQPPEFTARTPAEGAALPLEDAPSAPPADMIERWPGYQIARLRFEQEGVRLEVARSQAEPDISVELGFNRNSLESRGWMSLHASVRQHPGWSVGLVFEQPLGESAAGPRRDAQTRRAEAARLQADTEARVARNEWAVRAGQVQAVAREQALLRQELRNRQAVLAAEREQYQMGRSRLRQLVEVQDRVDENQVRLIDAEVRGQLARIALQAISGQLLDSFDVRLLD